MTMRRAAIGGFLLAVPLWLSGCVAAAIPVLAAGGIAQREIRADGQPPQAPDGAAPAIKPAPAAIPAPQIPAPQMPVVPAGQMPLPTGSYSATATLVAAGEPGSYASFINHAARQSALDPVAEPRNSAVLASAGSLRPVLQECGILPPAVIIDLDPAGHKLDPAVPLRADPALVQGLARLRSSDIAVFWTSGVTAIEAGKVREQLQAAGLDPTGRDMLLLMRRSDDRKELRRREISGTHCIVAIAGDTRSDFDELFEYLRNPAAATELDSLIGKGWFLAPPLAPPLAAPAPPPTQATLPSDAPATMKEPSTDE